MRKADCRERDEEEKKERCSWVNMSKQSRSNLYCGQNGLQVYQMDLAFGTRPHIVVLVCPNPLKSLIAKISYVFSLWHPVFALVSKLFLYLGGH